MHDLRSTSMTPSVSGKQLLLDTPVSTGRCRAQPLRHPRLEIYPVALLEDLCAYCYTCESWAVGVEVMVHLFFGELGCKYCFHTIKSCLAFRTHYPMTGICKGNSSGRNHNACRWVSPTCNYVMYNTRKTLSVARGINNKFEKQEVFREASVYLRALLPLRGLYPWRSALKTIAKAGIAVDLSNRPPRLRPLDPSKCRNSQTKLMLGVSGLLNIEKSIFHLEKRASRKTATALPLPQSSLDNGCPSSTDNTTHKKHKRRKMNPGNEEFEPSGNNTLPSSTDNTHKKHKRKMNPGNEEFELTGVTDALSAFSANTLLSKTHTLNNSKYQRLPLVVVQATSLVDPQSCSPENDTHRKHKKTKDKSHAIIKTEPTNVQASLPVHTAPCCAENTIINKCKIRKLKNCADALLQAVNAQDV